MDLQIAGDTALVSGSSRGLGKASATALAEKGVNVVINGRDEERLDDAVKEIGERASGEVVGHSGDPTDTDDIEALVDRTVDEFGGIDHLVTSIGGPKSGPFLETSDERWCRVFDTLVMSVVRLTRSAAPHLRADGGSTIVNVTSRTVKQPADDMVLSNSVRMAVVGIEKTLSREFAPDVRVNTVLPGGHEMTRVEDLVQQAADRGDVESFEDGMESREAEVPLEKLGDPMGFGRTVAYLCSEHAAYINGVALSIDGRLIDATL
jgi:3-oxoacyl-[acyl-carrier protein] reductase